MLICWLIITAVGTNVLFATQAKKGHTGSNVVLADSAGWSRPVPLPIHLENRVPDEGHDIALSNRGLHISFMTGALDNPFAFARDIWFMTRRDGGWSPPRLIAEASFSFTGAKITVTEQDGREVIHLIWGDQPSDIEYNRDHPPPFKAPNYIFYSNHKNGMWYEPDTLYHTNSRSIWFSRNLIKDREGSLVFAFSAIDTTVTKTSSDIVFVAKREKDQWLAPTPVATAGGDADLSVLNDGTLLLPYIRPDTAWARNFFSRDRNSVFFKMSSDEGKTWNESLVQRSETTPAHRPRVEVVGTGRIHLFWRQDTAGDNNTNNLAHAWSEDGNTWTEPEMLVTSKEGNEGFIYNYDMITTSQGTIHLMFVVNEGFGNLKSQLYHMIWNGHSWSTPEPLFNFQGVTQLALTCDEEKKQLHLVFLATTGKRDQRHLWNLYHSVFQE